MSLWIDDEKLPQYSLVCCACKHHEGGRACKAFPSIPEPIWSGLDGHTSPLPGDKGIQFELNNLED